MGFRGSVRHVMLYDFSISDDAAGVIYSGSKVLNNHNLAITHNSATLLVSERRFLAPPRKHLDRFVLRIRTIQYASSYPYEHGSVFYQPCA